MGVARMCRAMPGRGGGGGGGLGLQEHCSGVDSYFFPIQQ